MSRRLHYARAATDTTTLGSSLTPASLAPWCAQNISMEERDIMIAQQEKLQALELELARDAGIASPR
jgi:hypothetical protein